MENLLLIDGNSLINRAFYALPPLSNSKGEPMQGVFGFTTMLLKAMADYQPKYIAVAFDLKKPTFRHLMYDGYKATRKHMPEDLASQMPILKELLRMMNVAIVEKEGFEADDVIGTLARTEGVMTYVVTGDRDSFQLVDETTRVVFTRRGITDVVLVDEPKLMEMFSLTPKQIIDYKALAGDASDNIPGVLGIGDKTATNLINKYGSVASVYEHVGEIGGKLGEKLREGEEYARLSYELATIKTDVPLDVTLDDLTFDFPFNAEVRSFFVRNNFKSLLKRDDLFADGSEKEILTQKHDVSVHKITDLNELASLIGKEFGFAYGEEISIAVDAYNEWQIPVRIDLVSDGFMLGDVIAALKPILENPSVKKYVYDVKKLMKELRGMGVMLKNYDDVHVMQYLVDMSVNGATRDETLQNNGFDKQNPAAALLELGQKLRGEITRLDMDALYERAERPLSEVLCDMEERGVMVDVELLNRLGESFNKRVLELSERIYELAGTRFNINSPKKLAVVLFEDLAIPYPKKSKNYSTSAEILEQVQDKHPIVPLVSKWRLLSKLNSTYIEGMRKVISPDNVIHTDFKQTITTTGRLSSAEPNLQNIPIREDEGKQLRGLFVAREGYTLVSADYSQIELRLLAHFANDPQMIKWYNKGEDIHARTAAEMFEIPLCDVTESMRRQAKVINFGIIYGMSDYGLAQNLHCSVETARQYMQAYFARFASIKPYFESVLEKARENGCTTTLMNRLRYIPELNSSSYFTRQFGERAAMNMPLQGSAADIIKLAMVNVHDRLKSMKSKLILQIHDELIIEAADDEAEEVKKILVDCMQNAVSLRVPLTVEAKSGKSWLDC